SPSANGLQQSTLQKQNPITSRFFFSARIPRQYSHPSSNECAALSPIRGLESALDKAPHSPSSTKVLYCRGNSLQWRWPRNIPFPKCKFLHSDKFHPSRWASLPVRYELALQK